MRLWKLTAGEICLQWKYGFYFLYALFTALYLLVLWALPAGLRPLGAAVLVYSDPAAMGLFFMGGLVLFEKQQNIQAALAVSPVTYWEYMAAKGLSLVTIGLAVAGVLAWAGGLGPSLLFLVGVALFSLLCSGWGLVVAQHSRSLNQFIWMAALVELVLCLPAVMLLLGESGFWWQLHPGVAAALLLYGQAPSWVLCLASLAVWCALTLWVCHGSTRRYFEKVGGGLK